MVWKGGSGPEKDVYIPLRRWRFGFDEDYHVLLRPGDGFAMKETKIEYQLCVKWIVIILGKVTKFDCRIWAETTLLLVH